MEHDGVPDDVSKRQAWLHSRRSEDKGVVLAETDWLVRHRPRESSRVDVREAVAPERAVCRHPAAVHSLSLVAIEATELIRGGVQMHPAGQLDEAGARCDERSSHPLQVRWEVDVVVVEICAEGAVCVCHQPVPLAAHAEKTKRAPAGVAFARLTHSLQLVKQRRPSVRLLRCHHSRSLLAQLA